MGLVEFGETCAAGSKTNPTKSSTMAKLSIVVLRVVHGSRSIERFVGAPQSWK
jgi:hypothetical protein